ncbi:hypothetical protein PRZ48_000837 [Zasmidium cellare]|uniref:Cytochrome P450 n=1 Tax=Zasmidium cellare TaxID=395010 RepID=A0ABR0F181_ZASCE|nr:hypothetical protein PRZ48_000837 [Zasmidium cellare]
MSSPAADSKPSQWSLIQRFRNGIPGPFLAKLSPLWKIYHVLRGSYRKKVRELHERYGPLVQVGPNEFSLADKGLVYIPKLTSSPFAIDLNALEQLEKSARMANVYRNEHLIEKCNHQLLSLLAKAAETGGTLELSPLLARYAYETMLVTTTGQFAGFLEDDPDSDRIQTLMKDWKFYAVLYGSYLKYHPFIAKILRKCGLRGDSQHELFQGAHPDQEAEPPAEDPSDTIPGLKDEEQGLLHQGIEARIALTLAGADPAVILIRTALWYIYSDQELLQQLREEIENANLSETPTFKELIVERINMPLLHAVLLECIRLNTPMETGPTYKTREEDVLVGGYPMPEGTTIVIEPTVAHVNPTHFGDDAGEFQPTRWLDFDVGSAARRHLLAFNLAWTSNNLEELQILLTCKILTQLLPHFTMSPKVNNSGIEPTFNEEGHFNYDFNITRMTDELLHVKPAAKYEANSSAAGAWVDRPTVDSMNDVETIHAHLMPDCAKELCNGGRFDPARPSFDSKARLVTNPIANSMIRAKVRAVVKRIWGDRLWVKHQFTTDRLIIFPQPPNSSKSADHKNFRSGPSYNAPRFQPTQPKPITNGGNEPANTNAALPPHLKHKTATQDPPTNTPATSDALITTDTKYGSPEKSDEAKPRVPREDRPRKVPADFKLTEQIVDTCAKWQGWTATSEKHEASFKTNTSFEETKAKLAEQAEAAAKTAVAPPQNFKNTSNKVKQAIESKAEKTTETKATGFVPPHLRKKTV